MRVNKENLEHYIERALWWGNNQGPVVLFCDQFWGQALMDFGLDEFWVDILAPIKGPLHPELQPVGDEREALDSTIKDMIVLCSEAQDTLDKLLKDSR